MLTYTVERARFALFRALQGRGLSKLPGGRALFARVRSRFTSEHSIIHGYPVELDPKDAMNLSVFGLYEPLETAIVTARVRPGFVVLDIGAHIGYYTLLFSKLAGPTGRVYAFEPTPETFGILSRNLTRNAIGNTTPVNVAVGGRTQPFNLYISPKNWGDNHIFDVGDPDGRAMARIPITMVAIDDYLPADVRVDFVKMDIQGAEPAALAGMEKTLSRSRALAMMVEFWPSGMRRAGFEPSEFLDRLDDLGLTIHQIDSSQKRLVRRAKDWLVTDERVYELGTNLLCVRR